MPFEPWYLVYLAMLLLALVISPIWEEPPPPGAGQPRRAAPRRQRK